MAEVARSNRVVSTSLTGYTLGGFVAGEGCFTISTTRRKHKIRRVDLVTRIAGTGVAGRRGDGGPATKARLNAPQGVAWDAFKVLIADTRNHKIRRIE